MQLRLMTYNIQHGKGMDGRVSLKRIAEVMKQGEADVICVQEVERRSPRSAFADGPVLFAKALEMTPVFAPALRAPQFGEYGLLMLSRLPVASHAVHRLPGPPEKEPRIVLEAVVEADGGPVTVFTTHWGLSDEERRANSAATAEIVSASEHPALLAGDLNEDPEWSGPGHATLKAAGLVRLAPHEFTHSSEKLDKTIDHVYGSQGWEVHKLEVLQSLASDHLPVIVTLAR